MVGIAKGEFVEFQIWLVCIYSGRCGKTLSTRNTQKWEKNWRKQLERGGG